MPSTHLSRIFTIYACCVVLYLMGLDSHLQRHLRQHSLVAFLPHFCLFFLSWGQCGGLALHPCLYSAWPLNITDATA